MKKKITLRYREKKIAIKENEEEKKRKGKMHSFGCHVERLSH